MNESELNSALLELKKTPDEFNFVCALVKQKFNITEALKEAGRSKGWFYDKHSKEDQGRLISLAENYNAAYQIRTLEILNNAAPKAAEVLVEELENRDHRIKQAAAKDILDRTISKPPTKTELTGADGGKIRIDVTVDGD